MAVVNVSARVLSATSTLVSVVAPVEGDVYYWWQDGVLLEAGSRPWRQFDLGFGESVVVDVFDDAGDAPEVGLPGRVLLQWDAVSGATQYRVDLWDGAAWVNGRVMPAGSGVHFRWESGVLPDCAEALFRIVPIGVNEGAGREVGVFVIRRPDRPSGVFVYEDGDLVVS